MSFDKNSKIVIMGPGSVGMLIAAKLTLCGYSPTLYHYDDKKAMNLSGNIKLIEYDSLKSLPINAAVTADKTVFSSADLVIICVKSYSTESAAEILSEHLKTDAKILTLQNGLTARPTLLQYFRHANLYSATTSLGSIKKDDFTVLETGNGITTIEDKTGADSIADIFLSSGIGVAMTDNISSAIWQKAAINCAINPLGALLNKRNGELAADSELLSLMTAIANEVARVGEKLGVDVPKNGWKNKLSYICSQTKDNCNSMWQDLNNDKQTEIDALNGAVAAYAKSSDTRAVLNKTMTILIKSKSR